jgi:hypothetical protein
MLACWLTATPIVAGNWATGQNFDGPDPVWQLTSDRSRLIEQSRTAGGARSDAGCERLVVSAPVGESAFCQCRVAPVAVLDELAIRIWVKASRPDVRLAARVTMPRSVNEEGRPAVALVRGTANSRAGRWQQLVLNAVPELLAAEVRVMRTVPGAKVDPRQAYIDSIVLVVPGEPNGVEVFTDDLEVDGIVVDSPPGIELAGFAQDSPNSAPLPVPHEDRQREQPAVRLQGSVLLVEEKPFVPRVIEWQNEPFKFLAERGFNTVWLPSPPTADQVADAARHSLWFICSPPRVDPIVAAGLGQANDRVIAWLLNDPAIALDPEYGRQWAAAIRRHDVGHRPIIIAADNGFDLTGDLADLVLSGHPRAATMSVADYKQWLESRVEMARPGKPLWVTIPTQLGEQASQQGSALSGTLSLPPSVDAEQVAALVHIACTRGCRGAVFRSATPLDDGSPPTRRRAALLELTNRQLQLIEPWLGSGKSAVAIVSTDEAWRGAVFHVDRARLVVPLDVDRSARNVEFVVPGIPESSEAHYISLAAMHRLPLERVAGGVRVTTRVGAGGVILITEDLRIIQSFRQHIARNAMQAARLERDFVSENFRAAAAASRDLVQLGYHSDAATGEEASAAALVRQCDRLLVAGRPGEAYEAAESANQALGRAVAEWRRAIGFMTPLPDPVRDRERGYETAASHPLALSSEQLVALGKFFRSAERLRAGENLMYGGDFEDLGQMTQFGWVHVGRDMAGIKAHAKLATSQPRTGQYCLELSAVPDPASATVSGVNGAPIWIVSPPVSVVEGQIVEITGWVRIDTPIAGAIDGLQIVDSLGGAELALAVRQTTGWQFFRMIRAVPQSTELRLSFALTGMGSAWIDGVMVRTLDHPTIRRLPPVSPALDAASHTANTQEDTGPLFIAPGAR